MGQRLRTDIVPASYKIEITTDFSTFTFLGKEDVELQLARPSRKITLNASEIRVRSAYVEYEGKRQAARVSPNREGEQVTFRFADSVGSGSILHVEFKGRNGDGMYGFYRSRFGAGKGDRGYLLSSHFEPAHARTVFPCFDEPSFKATFELSIVADRDLEAISNMPIRSVVGPGGRKRVTFMPTPRMSSYLLYMGVGRFEHVSARYRGKPLRALGAPGKAAQCSKALEFAKRFLAYYERYFGIEYPLPKLDLIAVPDFAAGAMENWGAITFREQDMLYGRHTSTRTRTRIAEVISHELAHQWFGDLVTMGWWDDTWLNEAFAEFMSFKAMEAAYPAWKRALDFYDEEVDVAFQADEFRNTHPVYSPIKSVEEIDKVFDDISYRKGASVLRMLEDFIGEDNFRRGLHSYLLKHALSNAAKDDFWDALSKASKDAKDVRGMATAWVTKEGYPALHVDGGSVAQRRFFLPKGNSSPATWPVPVHYLSSDGSTGFVLIEGRKARLPPGKGAWTKLNSGQTGVYRTFYDRRSLETLTKAVAGGELGGVDAWGLITDIGSLALAGRMRVRDFLHYAGRFEGCSYPANIALLNTLTRLQRILYGTEAGREVEEAADRYSTAVLHRLGWKSREIELGHVKRLRSGAILASGMCGNSDTIAQCGALFSKAMAGKPIDKEIRRAVCEVVSFSGSATRGKLVGLYKRASSQEERMDVLAGLGMSGSAGTARAALAFAMSKDVRLQDKYVIPYVMSLNPVGPAVLWKWTRTNWKRLKRMYRPGTLLLSAFVESLECMRTERELIEMRAFFSKRENVRDDIKLDAGKTLEMISVNIGCLQSNTGR